MKTTREKIFWIAVFVFLLCGLYVFLTINGLSYQNSITNTPQANITVIPIADIPTPDTALLSTFSSLPTPDPSTVIGSGIRSGLYVQIVGTGGSGLNIRNSPELNGKKNDLAYESEVFLVIGGPIEQDGYTWWQLSAPYDKNRQGWAVEDYLHIITP